MIEIPAYKGYGRELMVQFKCYRCKKTALRPLSDSMPSDCPVRTLSDLEPPKEWRDGGFYYPMFCPDCKRKYETFMEGAEDGKAD